MGLYEDMLARIRGVPESAGFPAAMPQLFAPEQSWALPDTMLPPYMRRSVAGVDSGAPAVQSAIGNAPAGPAIPAPLQVHAGMLPALDQTNLSPFLTETERELQAGVGGPTGPAAPLPVARPDGAPLPVTPQEALAEVPPTAGGVDVGSRSRSRPAPIQIAPDVPPAGPAGPAAPAVGMMDNGLPGLLGRIRTTLGDNSNTLLAIGAGMAGAPNIGQGISRAAAAAIPARAADFARSSRGLTTKALIDAGVPVQLAIAAQHDPELKKAVVSKYMETKPAQVVNGRLVREHADGTVSTLADFGDDKKPPSGWRWKEGTNKSTLEYIPEGPADPKYLREKGEKNAAPPGYLWVDPADPEKGLKAIKDGPAEKVDAAVAARMGLAKNFLKQLPKIKQDVEKGMATGVINAGMAYTGYGRAGELRRQIESGSEALLRNLTGAGMSLPEAKRYVARYELQPHDTIERVVSKLTQLEGELVATLEEVGKGRGGSGITSGAPPPGTYVWDAAAGKLVPAK